MNASEPNGPFKSAVQLLQEINSGQTDPSLLDKASRQQCVELLIAEGYTQAQIAQIMKCSEKTVYRDTKEIYVRNELSPNAQLAKQLVGDMFKKAMSHHDYLIRVSRMKESSTAEKIQAVFAAWKILKEFVEKFQSLGYLPLRPQEVVGDIFHHIDESSEKSFDEIRKTISEIEVVTKETGGESPQITQEITQLKTRVEKAQLEYEANKLLKEQSKKEEDHGSKNQ